MLELLRNPKNAIQIHVQVGPKCPLNVFFLNFDIVSTLKLNLKKSLSLIFLFICDINLLEMIKSSRTVPCGKPTRMKVATFVSVF